ncbi:sulfonate ABC transporter substrate-binding protein [Prauserella sp. PE36]|uniref:ABC transporter substrate-binding protein n=1 Tax=Prauserella endophytica TaxID=1592324 RepID=A0ABY2S3M4_9PSEU|nr:MULTISPECIES: ABC transporter substrate-binding protein [Prauserella]PXY37119.1 sulfonate ABC transporter substrate-binding protein [Prauserella coralliicola]RBM10229.1 sulfonate ABC transporter substrate-binding protein [Prauserella sp. PE36]TKG68459.1 ABC transporter substrate-binding protein [Prauserella endophytica]
MLASTSGCGMLGGSDDSSEGGSGNLEKSKISVSVMPTIDLAPFHLAMKNGYFKDEGLDVEVVNAPSGQASLTKLINGEVDVAYSSYTPFFIAQSKGAAEFKFVADASSAGPKSTMVVTMPNSPVKKVQDLPGKSVAITSENTMSDTLTKSVMKTNGVDFSDVQWVSLPFPEMAGALQRGDVDAAFMTEPFITSAAKTIGAVPVFDTATGPTKDFPTAGYASQAQFADENPNVVAAFQRALDKATREAADRSKIEPLMVEFAKVDKEIASMTNLLTFQSKLDAQRLQRVPDLLLEFGGIPEKMDAASMIAQPAADS